MLEICMHQSYKSGFEKMYHLAYINKERETNYNGIRHV